MGEPEMYLYTDDVGGYTPYIVVLACNELGLTGLVTGQPFPIESMMICLPPRDTSPHQDSTGTAPSGTPPPAQPPPPPQTWGTQSHSAPLQLRTS